ncbi:cation:proton antiporter domain-containing protein [Caldovatus aquaticus]|uniref:Cation:proton antiporter n=1 Tax=Caldovatus aquaticus TaxID=2865671 RepID=A0ABS7F3A7_9PROT|nr:cation:proton antiporter [Caldovatus aquaticus]MBW8269467.1 cation:proton antiporter [Caldovatus aquaticus]
MSHLLLANLVVALTLAFAFGWAARALRLPPLFGYLLAGIAVGPHTPGFDADPALTGAMAEVGVALLLFGVGLHFQPRDLFAVWRVALPGAVAQVAFGTALGALVGHLALGLAAGPAAVFGLALAIASTAVATRLLEEDGALASRAGHVALGWLVMQDVLVVLALVLVPAAAGHGAEGLGAALGRTVLELLAFVAVVMLVGRRALPWALARVARGASRELFTLAVVVAALGTAFAASELFHVSFALGAFFAGLLLGESDLGHQAAAETVPLQRVFAALFFVSVGMLVDPRDIAAAPLTAAAALLAVLAGTGGATFALLLLLRVPLAMAATVAAALAQIGEFSFVLVQFAIALGVLPPEAGGPVLAAAFGAILLTPLSRRLARLAARRLIAMPGLRRWQERGGGRALAALPDEGLAGHAILVGHGRVGRIVAAALRRHGLPYVVIEQDRAAAEHLRAQGVRTVWGDATRPEVMAAARPERARLLILALPGAAEARAALALARAANPEIVVAARAHDDGAMRFLAGEGGAGLVVMGEREIALSMADFALRHLGVDAETAQGTVDGLRAEVPGAV